MTVVEANYRVDLDSKQKHFEAIQQERETQVEMLEKRFSEYRVEQAKVQEVSKLQVDCPALTRCGVKRTSEGSSSKNKRFAGKTMRLLSSLSE